METPAAAAALGIAVRTLHRIIGRGELPAHSVDGVVGVKRSEIEKYIERARLTPGDLVHLHY